MTDPTSKLIKDEKNDKIDFCKTYSSSIGTRYDFYLTHVIDDSFNFNDLFDILRKASDKDEVFIHINSPGGYVDASSQIINNIKECSAVVTTIMEGQATSAASMIFLSGDEKIVRNHGYMLCHYYSGGCGGKGNEIISRAKFGDKYMRNLFKEIYNKFLTSDEISRLIKGEDFWFSAKEVRARLLK